MDSSDSKPKTHERDYAALSEQFASPLRRYFQRHLARPDEADDMVQEVFTKLLKANDPGPLTNPQAYLFKIASNLLRDKRRREVVRQIDLHEPFDDTYHAHQAISPERVLIGKQELDRLKTAILKFPPRVRAVFFLHRFEGLKYREISETLGISISSVEKHMMTAIRRLAKEFGRK